MKKFLLSLLCLISFMAINAETITFSNTDFSGSSSSYVTTETTSTVSDVTFAYNNFNPSSGQIRGNKSNVSQNFYFYNTTPINGTITSIKIKTDNGLSRNFIYVTTGNTKLGTLTDGTKVGDSSIATTTVTYNATDGGSFFEIYFKNGATSGTVKLLSIEITYESAGGEVVETVATPVFSLDGGEITADTEISIECATEDATIKYTIDDTEPSVENGTVYTAPFKLNADATVKAIAIKDGYNNSVVATATYTMFVASKDSYKLVTSVVDGGHYIIVGADGENYFAMGEQKNNNRAAIAVTVTNGIIANPTVRVCEFEIQKGAIDNTWAFNTGAGYLYAASSGRNYLRTETTLSNNSSATIVIDEATGVATIKFQGSNTRNWMRYNSSSELFACYESGQNDIYLYQRVGDIPTGIEDTMVDENAPVEYYNLQGVKVANPENGIFIKKQGGRTSKVVL